MFYEEVLNMVLNKYKYVSVRGCLLIYLFLFVCINGCVYVVCVSVGEEVYTCVYVCQGRGIYM